jgi:hypothetical protein
MLPVLCFGQTQSNKFFEQESDSIKVKKVKKKLSFGVSVGLGSTILSDIFKGSYTYGGTSFGGGSNYPGDGLDVFKRRTINSLPNFNLIISKSFKKNSILFNPGIRTITAKLNSINSYVSDVFFGTNFSDTSFFKEFKVNQLYIDLPIIYNIKLNNIFSINLGLSAKLPISGNFSKKFNSFMIHTNYENLIQKTYYDVNPSGRPLNQGESLMRWDLFTQDQFIFPDSFNFDELSDEDKVTKMHLIGSTINVLPTIICGIDVNFNKKNKINLSYRLSTVFSEYHIENNTLRYNLWRGTSELENVYYENKLVTLQFLEINYVHLF